VKLRLLLAFIFLLILCAYSSRTLTGLIERRPVAIRLGYMPASGIIKLVAADFQPLIAQAVVAKVMFYYGSLVDERFNRSGDRPEYFQMFKTLEKAIQLDPYNMDPYYFLQATYTWELNRAADVNKLLIYGMKYRDWDYWLPFYAGFNAAYFLGDADTAGQYLQRAAELSGNKTYASLASRAYYLAGKPDLAIAFLEDMVDNAKDELSRSIYKKRLLAMRTISQIEKARNRYLQENKMLPASVADLVQIGLLPAVPVDPYGGDFYLDKNGKVLTTSRLYDQ
jgi:tetratricopeptide (TPR) repeat protein